MIKNLLIVVLGAGLVAALIVLSRRDSVSEVAVDDEQVWVRPAEVEESRYAVLGVLIDEALAKPGMEGAAIGLCVIDAAGEVVFDRHARTAFIPASSLKTLTTATALEVFGPDYRIETQVRATAPVVDGVVDGDVVLLGGGDPMLTIGELRLMADELRTVAGVRSVTGRVIGSGLLFEGSIFDDFWNWGDIGNGYGSGVSGLNVNHNRFEVELRQGEGGVGDPADLVGVTPEVPGVRFVNQVRLAGAGTGDGVTIHGGEQTATIFFRGTVPADGESLLVTGAVPDPARFAAHHFKVKIAAAGEAVGIYLPGELPQLTDAVLVSHLSPPLRDIVRSVHYTSDNHETECLFRLLGLREGKSPVEVIRDHWSARGLEFQGLRMEDGSGLARADFITPHDLAKLQFLAGGGEQGEVYKGSLLAREDGALRWKGGAMSSVRSYAGYAMGADGEERCFALMVNHCTDSGPVGELREALWTVLRGL